MWPDRNIIRRNLPTMFWKYYPKCVVIIDCAEVFIQTLSSLDNADMCLSDYKHHSTMKYLVGYNTQWSHIVRLGLLWWESE